MVADVGAAMWYRSVKQFRRHRARLARLDALLDCPPTWATEGDLAHVRQLRDRDSALVAALDPASIMS